VIMCASLQIREAQPDWTINSAQAAGIRTAEGSVRTRASQGSSGGKLLPTTAYVFRRMHARKHALTMNKLRTDARSRAEGRRIPRECNSGKQGRARTHWRLHLLDACECKDLCESVRHFLEVLDELNRLQIEFVSFRENIDTSGPLGRAMVVTVGAIAELERNLSKY
jgi:Resolvase, N terminal domain